MPDDYVTKSQLLQKLREGESHLLTNLTNLPPEAFERGTYENGWNGRQVLAHIAGIEWTYPLLLDVASGARPAREEKPKETAAKPAQGGINSYNDRTVERYKDNSAAELLEIFKTNRARTISAIEAADENLFSVPVRSAGGIPGPLGTVLNFVAVMHVEGHVNDIVAAAAKN